MKIVIIGAGISGLASYLSLKKHLPRPSAPASDHVYTIYEAYDTDKDSTFEQRLSPSSSSGEILPSSTLIVGGGLGVAPNGVKALQRLDPAILKDIVSGGYTVSKYNMKSRNGALLMSMESSVPTALDQNNNDENRNVVYTVGTSRHSLWRCLRTRVPSEIIINKRISGVETNSDDGKILVRFADGSEPVEADLVIGADGLKSVTRKALFPDVKDDVYPAQYEGLVGIGGFIPLTPELRQNVGRGTMTFVFGGNGFFGYFPSTSTLNDPNRDSASHISEPGDQLGWWSTYAMEECPKDLRNINREEILRDLRERYKNWRDPVVQHIISNEGLEIKNMYPTWTAPEIPTWERNGIVLVGDAAHALPSTSGQGSSQALEDVECLTLFLAHELRNGYKSPLQTQTVTERAAVVAAAKRYVALRKPHVKKILDRAKQIQNNKRNMSFVQECFMYFFMWVMGWFPSIVSKPLRETAGYNIKEEVERILSEELRS